MAYFEKSYNYEDFETVSENLNEVPVAENIWIKKQKSKPYYKYSPRRGGNRFNSPLRMYQGLSEVNMNEVPDGKPHFNENKPLRWVLDSKQSENADNDFTLVDKRVRNKTKINNSKNSRKDEEPPITWTLPQDKKFQ